MDGHGRRTGADRASGHRTCPQVALVSLPGNDPGDTLTDIRRPAAIAAVTVSAASHRLA